MPEPTKKGLTAAEKLRAAKRTRRAQLARDGLIDEAPATETMIATNLATNPVRGLSLSR